MNLSIYQPASGLLSGPLLSLNIIWTGKGHKKKVISNGAADYD